ncbi:hypothetical protein BDZ45DRAFT_698802 [Acephala macrosclerotiorum]|nr:hypothetical protein BDZ45DRAFT_698802 [Acephala macrosclerotiorum]
MASPFIQQFREQLEEIYYPMERNFNFLSINTVKSPDKQCRDEFISARTATSPAYIAQDREQLEEISYPVDENTRLLFKPRTTTATTTDENRNDETTKTNTGPATEKLPLTLTLAWPTTPFSMEGLPPTPPMSPGPIGPKLEYHIQFDTKLQHWTRNLVVFLMHPSTNRNMGQAQARYIDRAIFVSLFKSKKKQIPNLRPFSFSNSVEHLNEGNSDGLALAQQLFNRDGALMKKHVVGSWGTELNKGAILILSYLLVKRDFRRQALAGKAIQALIEKAKMSKGGVKFIFVRPGVIKEDLDLEGKDDEEKEQIEKRALESAIRFYRSFGFRRVGYSEWFCFAIDEEHASRSVAVKDDLELPNGKDKGVTWDVFDGDGVRAQGPSSKEW